MMQPVDILAPIGCHCYHNRAIDQWELTLFASATETVGGQYDGRRTTSRFVLNLENILDNFDTVNKFHWQAHALGPLDDLGPHLSIEGTVDGHSVWLRVLASPPEEVDAGRTFEAYSLRLTDHW